MDGAAHPDEAHDYPEGLLVLDGAVQLTIHKQPITVGAAELFVVPAGVPRAVAPGSDGILVSLDV
jgi:quercetin dioxygenase-like cupin family protein